MTGKKKMNAAQMYSPRRIESIRRHRSAYLIAVGGAAFLVSQAIRASRVVRGRCRERTRRGSPRAARAMYRHLR